MIEPKLFSEPKFFVPNNHLWPIFFFTHFLPTNLFDKTLFLNPRFSALQKFFIQYLYFSLPLNLSLTQYFLETQNLAQLKLFTLHLQLALTFWHEFISIQYIITTIHNTQYTIHGTHKVHNTVIQPIYYTCHLMNTTVYQINRLHTFCIILSNTSLWIVDNNILPHSDPTCLECVWWVSAGIRTV